MKQELSKAILSLEYLKVLASLGWFQLHIFPLWVPEFISIYQVMYANFGFEMMV
jgi:hypothetical protein